MNILIIVLSVILGSYIHQIVNLKRQKKLDDLSGSIREKCRKEARDLFNNIDRVELYYGDTDGAIQATASVSTILK